MSRSSRDLWTAKYATDQPGSMRPVTTKWGKYREGNTNHNAVPAANMEQGSRNEPLGEKKIARLDGPCSITFLSYRRRLTDPDGCCGKFLLDSLVSAGLFTDDSAKYIKKVSYEQIKITNQEQERTEIIITEDDSDLDSLHCRRPGDDFGGQVMLTHRGK